MNEYLENLFSLKGKTAVVIGGTGELCGKIAEGLAGAGANVVLVGRNPEKAQEKLNLLANTQGKHSFEACDVSTRENLEQLLAATLKNYPQIDILINGAGVNSPTAFLEISEEEYERIFSINTQSTFLACQVFGEYFLNHKIEASIINIGSMSGIVPLSRVFTYSMTKAAVHNLTKNLAREWAPHNIRVNTLVPGFIPAEQNKKVLSPDRIESIMNHTPIKRFGKPDELIGAALLLTSPAGVFITGSELIVDGGFSAMTI